MAEHAGHVAIATSSTLATQAEALQAASVTSLIVAALTTLLPSVAVIWSNGATITPPDIFREAALALQRHRIPVAEWVGFRWLAASPTLLGEPQFGMVTTGLAPFIRREIELLPSPLPPAVLMERIADACRALIVSAAAAEDDNILGYPHAERIRVRHRSQGTRPGLPVLELRVEAPDAVEEEEAPRRFGRRRAE